MANINIDLTKKIGKIKPMHAVGQPPISGASYNLSNSFHYLTDASIPYSRLHDVGGMFGGYRYVDVPNIFRDFDADENDPANYNFTFTDVLIKGLIDAKVEPYFRLGVTIENSAQIKSYRIDPPDDYDKWARICEHIIAHYNEGWADGFHYNITYWEIWNEPDDLTNGGTVSMMWNGTAEDYYRLYDVAAKHLKKCFPNIKIGGYAAIGFQTVTDDPTKPDEWTERAKYWLQFFHGFMKYIKAHGSPIDFFSWHCYRTAERCLKEGQYVLEQLKAYGYGDIECHLNEWNPDAHTKGTAVHGAQVMAIMLGMQNIGMDMLCFYDARLQGSMYAGFFNPLTLKPWQAYYSAAAFGELYKLKNQVELINDTDGLHAVCASNGKRNVMVISNVSGKAQKLNISGADFTDARYSVIDHERLLSWSPAITELSNNTVVMIEW